MQPLVLYSHSHGPNPWKLRRSQARDLHFAEPNGRLPSIVDPNTGIKLWESDAIVEYLIDQCECRQWLFFQVSGQAPYYGQASWFINFHPEKVQSAVDRYIKEMHRVNNVLDKVLRQGTFKES
ncbi:glutathione S-transferase-1 [Colletotrichum simmondsii]|uniref:Glutathione S-transferase-1 n=1 Tax=Colletotrichum simmondsii TaxID=703756 RepID=A0A135T7L1_9PEZI|nr:glutathione S-transferase-1 [Colletotrichum simmondsii]